MSDTTDRAALPDEIRQLVDDHSVALEFLRELAPTACCGDCGSCLRCRVHSWLHTEPVPKTAEPANERTCPCGFDNEPWHFPRGGMCSIGANMPVRKP